MNHFSRYSIWLAGAMLIAGPALIVCAALVAAAGIGTTTGRWYDNRVEGLLMAIGYSLQLIGLLEVCRRIGAARPRLGILTTLTSVLGTAGAIFPSAVRIFAAVELDLGFTVAQLDRIHGPSNDGTDPLMIIFPFVLCFFLNFLMLLPIGLWQSRTGPRFVPLLLVAGTILFILGQSTFEVGMLAYVAGVTAWFLGLASLGFWMLRQAGEAQPALAGAGSTD